MIKSIRNFLKLQRETFVVPKFTQDLIPVRDIWPDGIFLSRNGNMFSRTWRYSDINYAVASSEDQHAMFMDTSAFINAAELGGLVTLTVFNRGIDRASMERDVLYKLRGDAQDRFRRDKNAILIDQTALLNGNAIILGTSGSGKSMYAKDILMDKILNSDDDVFVIDPESEARQEVA
jgi:hypothetical protein